MWDMSSASNVVISAPQICRPLVTSDCEPRESPAGCHGNHFLSQSWREREGGRKNGGREGGREGRTGREGGREGGRKNGGGREGRNGREGGMPADWLVFSLVPSLPSSYAPTRRVAFFQVGAREGLELACCCFEGVMELVGFVL